MTFWGLFRGLVFNYSVPPPTGRKWNFWVVPIYHRDTPFKNSLWRHQMETFSALLAICAGNSPVTGEFPTQRPVTRSFDVYFDLCPNERLSKQSWGWWFETLSRSLWRHRNVTDKCQTFLFVLFCIHFGIVISNCPIEEIILPITSRFHSLTVGRPLAWWTRDKIGAI